MKKPIIYAHRGASKYAPENTMAAFRKAFEMNAQGIELDTHLTRDGHLVVTHDHMLGRNCNGLGLIKDLDLKYLSSLDFGSWFSNEFTNEKIPLLSEVIEYAIENNLMLNIEIKAETGYYDERINDKVAGIIKHYSIAKNTIVSSFNHYILLNLKVENSDIVTAPLFCGLPLNIWDYARKMGAGAIHPCFSYTTAEMIDKCRDNEILVNVWTVDGETDLKKSILAGVDSIITNVPDVASKVMRDL